MSDKFINLITFQSNTYKQLRKLNKNNINKVYNINYIPNFLKFNIEYENYNINDITIEKNSSIIEKTIQYISGYDEIYCIVSTNYHKILFHHLKQELKPFLEHKNILFNYIELNLVSHKKIMSEINNYSKNKISNINELEFEFLNKRMINYLFISKQLEIFNKTYFKNLDIFNFMNNQTIYKNIDNLSFFIKNKNCYFTSKKCIDHIESNIIESNIQNLIKNPFHINTLYPLITYEENINFMLELFYDGFLLKKDDYIFINFELSNEILYFYKNIVNEKKKKILIYMIINSLVYFYINTYKDITKIIDIYSYLYKYDKIKKFNMNVFFLKKDLIIDWIQTETISNEMKELFLTNIHLVDYIINNNVATKKMKLNVINMENQNKKNNFDFFINNQKLIYIKNDCIKNKYLHINKNNFEMNQTTFEKIMKIKENIIPTLFQELSENNINIFNQNISNINFIQSIQQNKSLIQLEQKKQDLIKIYNNIFLLNQKQLNLKIPMFLKSQIKKNKLEESLIQFLKTKTLSNINDIYNIDNIIFIKEFLNKDEKKDNQFDASKKQIQFIKNIENRLIKENITYDKPTEQLLQNSKLCYDWINRYKYILIKKVTPKMKDYVLSLSKKYGVTIDKNMLNDYGKVQMFISKYKSYGKIR